MTLSEFIFHVIAAIKGVTYDDYYPNAGTWHGPNDSPPMHKCKACLAGLYAAAQAWVRKNQYIFAQPEHGGPNPPLTYERRRILDAIDSIRCGQWQGAVECLQQLHDYRKMKVPITSCYPEKPLMEDFKGWDQLEAHIESLTQRAKELRKAGY